MQIMMNTQQAIQHLQQQLSEVKGHLGGVHATLRQFKPVAQAVMEVAKREGHGPAQMSHLTMELMSIYRDLDRIPGKVVTYSPSTTPIEFTVADEGNRLNAANIQISTDGPFIQTSYPLVSWRPIKPDGSAGPRATDFGLSRPVSVQYLPRQQFGNNFIEVSWELTSGGSQRLQQNTAALPFFSRPDYNNRLPQPYVWGPNQSIMFQATMRRIVFGGDVPTTAGQLEVTIPGYRIVDQ